MEHNLTLKGNDMTGFKTMDKHKKDIIENIELSLKNKVDAFFIVGSFLDDKWKPFSSDIDLICVDKSFSYYPYYTNIKFIQNNLIHLDYKFDIKLYNWKQLDALRKKNSRFHNELEKGLSYVTLDL